MSSLFKKGSNIFFLSNHRIRFSSPLNFCFLFITDCLWLFPELFEVSSCLVLITSCITMLLCNMLQFSIHHHPVSPHYCTKRCNIVFTTSCITTLMYNTVIYNVHYLVYHYDISIWCNIVFTTLWITTLMYNMVIYNVQHLLYHYDISIWCNIVFTTLQIIKIIDNNLQMVA